MYLTHVDGKSRKGRRGGGWSNNPLPPAFDQQAFMEAIGVATATIAQASVAAGTIAQASATTKVQGTSSFDLQGMRGSDDSGSLVLACGKDIRGYGDHLRCHSDKTSDILARG